MEEVLAMDSEEPLPLFSNPLVFAALRNSGVHLEVDVKLRLRMDYPVALKEQAL